MRAVYIMVFLCVVAISCLVVMQRNMEANFNSHWHYTPSNINIALNTPRLSDNPGYFLTKPKPKCQSTSVGYIFWSYTCGGR
jgi:hypothetical protein